MVHTYTTEEIQELIKCSTDPFYFIENYIKLEGHDGLISIELNNIQTELLDFYHNNRFCLSSVFRQAGQSTLISAYLLWFAMFNGETATLVCSSKLERAKQIINIIKGMHSRLPHWLAVGKDPTEWNKVNVSFANGSRIITQAVGRNTSKGMSLNLVYADDLNLVQSSDQEGFFHSVFPVLASSRTSKIILNALPSRRRDFVNQLYHDALVGKNKFSVLNIPIDEASELAIRMKELLGGEVFEAEFSCKWVEHVS